jgi:hypothetical protein
MKKVIQAFDLLFINKNDKLINSNLLKNHDFSSVRWKSKYISSCDMKRHWLT